MSELPVDLPYFLNCSINSRVTAKFPIARGRLPKPHASEIFIQVPFYCPSFNHFKCFGKTIPPYMTSFLSAPNPHRINCHSYTSKPEAVVKITQYISLALNKKSMGLGISLVDENCAFIFVNRNTLFSFLSPSGVQSRFISHPTEYFRIRRQITIYYSTTSSLQVTQGLILSSMPPRSVGKCLRFERQSQRS